LIIIKKDKVKLLKKIVYILVQKKLIKALEDLLKVNILIKKEALMFMV